MPAEEERAPIIVRSYDLCAALYEHVDRFPRAQRTLLGRVILDEGLRMLTALSLANRLADKREALAEASGRLDALRISLRLAKRLGFLSGRGYEHLTAVADEIGRMLGGWLKHERDRGADAGEGFEAASAAAGADAPSTTPGKAGAVRYTMQSPLVERYLNAKLAHPDAVVLVGAGAFCQAFFEDARLVGRELGLTVRDLAADSEPEKIFACGIPKARLEAHVARLGQPGREVHVE
ncbi:MAG: hypothetical protein FJW90_12210 [Actinobacteria bacterium]|nr:hypothetical protein [Actinomycetota bacterium]